MPTLAGLLLLALLQQPDTVMAHAKRVAATLGDTSAARRRGFGPLAAGDVSDLTPFQGQHWLHRWRVSGGSRDLDEPAFVMFVPIDGRLLPAGLAYSKRISADSVVPRSLAGVPTPWHLHQPCALVPGEGETLADGEADCRARGGYPRPPQIAMVHVWTDIPNPEGPYAHDNVALPYRVTGLTLPKPVDVATPQRAKRVRALGLALGETFGAVLPYARLVQLTSNMPGLNDSLTAHRGAIRQLVPELRAADQDRRRDRWNGLVDRAIREWQAMARLYRQAAPSDAIRAQLDEEQAAALGAPAHAHHH